MLLLVKAFIITESAANAAGSAVWRNYGDLNYGLYNRLFTDFQLFYPDFFYLVKIKA